MNCESIIQNIFMRKILIYFMVTAFQSSSARTVSHLFSILAILSASVAAIYLLLPNPLADAFFAGWVLVSVILTLVGGIAVWTNRTPLVWVAALLLTALSIVGMWSIGLFIAPAALFLLGAALLSQRASPQEDIQEAIIDNPPTVPETVLKTLTGIGSVAIGGGFIYVGAARRGLFGACATETLNCALAKAHWEAVGITVFGLIAVGLGGWLLWKQIYITRVLASDATNTTLNDSTHNGEK